MLLNTAYWGLSAGLKPIAGIDYHTAEDFAEWMEWSKRPRIDRKALYVAAKETPPTHSYTDSIGRYEGVIMDTVEGPMFVGFLTGGRWAIPHDTCRIDLAEPLAQAAK